MAAPDVEIVKEHESFVRRAGLLVLALALVPRAARRSLLSRADEGIESPLLRVARSPLMIPPRRRNACTPPTPKGDRWMVFDWQFIHT